MMLVYWLYRQSQDRVELPFIQQNQSGVKTGEPIKCVCRRRTWGWNTKRRNMAAPIPNWTRSRKLYTAEKQLTAEKQPIAEKPCMARPSVLHTGNSSSCLPSPVPNGPSLVSHAWLSGDPVKTGELCSSSSKQDITWIQDLRSITNSGISTRAIPAQPFRYHF